MNKKEETVRIEELRQKVLNYVVAGLSKHRNDMETWGAEAEAIVDPLLSAVHDKGLADGYSKCKTKRTEEVQAALEEAYNMGVTNGKELMKEELLSSPSTSSCGHSDTLGDMVMMPFSSLFSRKKE
jgi:hypothetical protein